VLANLPGNKNWSLFSELRRTLRGMVYDPIFSLFLTTAGRFQLFSPEIQSDPSNRVINNDLIPLPPISEASFDNLALPARESMVTLHRVTQMDWIARLGRPLCVDYTYFKGSLFTNSSRFGAYYMAWGDEGELLRFAKQKLLNGPSTLIAENHSGSLACLCVRFALDFNIDSISREVACTQVERHMRLCLAATTGFERLITVAGSEPLLAEAASQLMGGDLARPVRHLANHSDLNCIDRGRRGELVAALIIMQARDEASAKERTRWVSVEAFMKALLPMAAFEYLMDSLPTSRRAGEDRKFKDTFKDYALWFNHAIKVQDHEIINVRYLWTFITRGAMVICDHNQYGVDIILPLCLRSEGLSRNTVSAILIQVKNAQRYGTNIDNTLFYAMDPVPVGLFDKNSPQRPVIRMVFALASDEGGISFPLVPTRKSSRRQLEGDGYTAFDIWCAGLSENTFKGIGDDLTSYNVLLDRSLHSDNAFELQETNDVFLDDKIKASRGRQRRRMAPSTMAKDDHLWIHAEEKEGETVTV
jgi:hypothetical protein